MTEPIFQVVGEELLNEGAMVIVCPPEISSANLVGETKAFRLKTELPSSDSLLEFAKLASKNLREQGVIRATVIGVSTGSALAQAMVLANKKMFRRLVLVDGTSRQDPGALTQGLDFLESLSPFGLPFRRLGREFDSRPYLHRIDCPALLIETPSARNYQKSQTRILAAGLPNSWVVKTGDPKTEISSFVEAPARKPQKAA